MSKYQRYSREFKIEAMRLLAAGEKPASEITRSLGIRRNQLYKWRDEIRDKGDTAFAGPGAPSRRSGGQDYPVAA